MPTDSEMREAIAKTAQSLRESQARQGITISQGAAEKRIRNAAIRGDYQDSERKR